MACTDVLVVPLLREIRTCVVEQFALCGRLPCRFPITWGVNVPPADACDCTCGVSGQGQAWVRWVATTPARLGGGTGGGANAAGCAGGTFDVTLEVGVYRCWPEPDEAGPLDESEEEHAALGMLVDAAAIRRGLACCPYLEERSWQMVKESPVAHSGGCTGVSAQLTVTGSDCECGDFSLAPRSIRAQTSALLGQAA